MKRKILAWALSLAMVFSVIPAAPIGAEETSASAQSDREIAAVSDDPAVASPVEPTDYGLTAAVTSDYTAPWEKLDGIKSDWEPEASNSGTGKGWGNWKPQAEGSEHWVQYDWSEAVTVNQMWIYWYDDGGNTKIPGTLKVQYRGSADEEWTDASMISNYADAQEIDQYNVIDIQEITAKSIRLLMTIRTGAQAMGIYRWKVMNGETQADKLKGVTINGSSSIGEGKEKDYSAAVVPSTAAAGVTYAWSVEPSDIAAIQGDASGSSVKVKALKAGKATLKLTASKDGKTVESTRVIQVEGVESIDTYKTSTAAGVAPILPDSVVANGLIFDDPTPSLKTENNNVDLGETFESKLIPVTWDAVDPAEYAQDKIGKTFTVTGKAAYEGKEFDAAAEITVKEPAAAAESNRQVTFENVQLNDAFWAPKQETNALVSLDKAILEISKPSGGEPNFDNAIKKLNGEEYEAFSGFVFQDSDIYKSIEAISYTLSATQNDTGEEIEAQRAKLQSTLNSWIEKIEKVQYADGYIDTFFTLRSTTYAGGESTGTHRWKNFSNHEMYNAGHFLEAVVAYTRYTEGIGKPDYRLYVAGKRFADHIVSLFGENGARHEVPGHEEIELALVKFGKLAEEYEGAGAGDNYYKTAKIFIDRRGEVEYDEETDEITSNPRDSGYYGHTYSQDKTPFVEETNAKGHSVRAGYFYAGVTDVATTLEENNTDRKAYLNSLDKIWDSVTNKKTYITGGIGTTAPSSDSEGFGDDYVLPNDQSYCEICAAISMANWNQRMNLLYEDGKYADSVEKALYNAILVGTNLDGNRFYYSTLLEAKNGNWRSEWFSCACCPPNLMRTLAALSGYMYTVHNDNLFVNMYVGSNGTTTINGTSVDVAQKTNYPWDGNVELTVNPKQSKAFNLKVRIPAWVAEQTNKTVTIKVNGETVNAAVEKGYATISRTWAKDDKVTIEIPMEIRKTEADPNVTTNDGRIALQRGPIVYSLEKAGNAQLNPEIKDFDPLKIVIPRNAKLKADYNEELLKGVVEITGDAKYSMYGELLPIKIQAVPYYAWNNRGDDADYTPGNVDRTSSKMLIWTMADKAQTSTVVGAADDAGPSAKVTSDKTYSGARIEGVHDSTFEPSSSSLGNGLGWSNWTVPRDDTPHYLQYTWNDAITTKQMQIYWYENYPWDRKPGTLKIQYQDASGNWQDATMRTEYKGVADKLNQYNTIDIDEITTKAIRLIMTVNLEDENTQSIGVYRWKVMLDKASVAQNVINMINAIGTVEATEDSRKLIYDARMAYESLSDELKAMVTNVDILTAAEKSFAKASADAAKAAIDLIEKIGTVDDTDACHNRILDARKAYNALNIFQRAAVSNYDVLVAAEEKYEELIGTKPSLTDISKATVAAIPNQKYTVTALTPAVTVTYGGKTLVKDTDYKVSYSNNINVGTATVTITGIGSYTGTLTAAFKIEAQGGGTQTIVDIAAAKAAAISDQKFTGKALTPAVTVTYNGKALVKDTDYTVAYSNNKNIGTATVTITGTGNYKGTLTTTFKIIVKKNASYTVGNYKYKITNANTSGKGTVTLTGVKNKSTKNKLTKITVADSVKIGGKSFAITVIGKSAFSGCKKAASATIGKKVTKIETKAFEKCSKLKKITIKATNLKLVGKNAFKGIHKNAKITVPKSKLNKYKKLLKSKGQKKSVKIQK